MRSRRAAGHRALPRISMACTRVVAFSNNHSSFWVLTSEPDDLVQYQRENSTLISSREMIAITAHSTLALILGESLGKEASAQLRGR